LPLLFSLELIPVIDCHPEDQDKNISDDDESLSLECIAKGAKSYHWERKGGEMSSNVEGMNRNKLTINNLQPIHSGSYRCVVANGDQKISSRYAKINIACECFVTSFSL